MTDSARTRFTVTNIVTGIMIGSLILGLIFLIVLVASPAEHDADGNVIRGNGWALYLSASFFGVSIIGCGMLEGANADISNEELGNRIDNIEQYLVKSGFKPTTVGLKNH